MPNVAGKAIGQSICHDGFSCSSLFTLFCRSASKWDLVTLLDPEQVRAVDGDDLLTVNLVTR